MLCRLLTIPRETHKELLGAYPSRHASAALNSYHIRNSGVEFPCFLVLRQILNSLAGILIFTLFSLAGRILSKSFEVIAQRDRFIGALSSAAFLCYG